MPGRVRAPKNPSKGASSGRGKKTGSSGDGGGSGVSPSVSQAAAAVASVAKRASHGSGGARALGQAVSSSTPTASSSGSSSRTRAPKLPKPKASKVMSPNAVLGGRQQRAIAARKYKSTMTTNALRTYGIFKAKDGKIDLKTEKVKVTEPKRSPARIEQSKQRFEEKIAEAKLTPKQAERRFIRQNYRTKRQRVPALADPEGFRARMESIHEVARGIRKGKINAPDPAPAQIRHIEGNLTAKGGVSKSPIGKVLMGGLSEPVRKLISGPESQNPAGVGEAREVAKSAITGAIGQAQKNRATRQVLNAAGIPLPPKEVSDAARVGVPYGLEYLTRPASAVEAGLGHAAANSGLLPEAQSKKLKSKMGPVDAFLHGYHNADDLITGGDLAEAIGAPKQLGLPIDVALDPLTYTGAGLASRAGVALRTGVKVRQLEAAAPKAVKSAQFRRLQALADRTGDFAELDKYLDKAAKGHGVKFTRNPLTNRKLRRQVVLDAHGKDVKKILDDAKEGGVTVGKGHKLRLPGETATDAVARSVRSTRANRTYDGLELRAMSPLGRRWGGVKVPGAMRIPGVGRRIAAKNEQILREPTRLSLSAGRHIETEGNKAISAATKPIRNDKVALARVNLYRWMRHDLGGDADQLFKNIGKPLNATERKVVRDLDAVNAELARHGREVGTLRAELPNYAPRVAARIEPDEAGAIYATPKDNPVKEKFSTSGGSAGDAFYQRRRKMPEATTMASPQILAQALREASRGAARRRGGFSHGAPALSEKAAADLAEELFTSARMRGAAERLARRLQREPEGTLPLMRLTQDEASVLPNPHTDRPSASSLMTKDQKELFEIVDDGETTPHVRLIARDDESEGFVADPYDTLTGPSRTAHMIRDAESDLADVRTALKNVGPNSSRAANLRAEEVRLEKEIQRLSDDMVVTDTREVVTPNAAREKLPYFEERRQGLMDQSISRRQAVPGKTRWLRGPDGKRFKATVIAVRDDHVIMGVGKRGGTRKSSPGLPVERTFEVPIREANENYLKLEDHIKDLKGQPEEFSEMVEERTALPVADHLVERVDAGSHGADPYDYAGRLPETRQRDLTYVLDPRVSDYYRVQTEALKTVYASRWRGIDEVFGRNADEVENGIAYVAGKGEMPASRFRAKYPPLTTLVRSKADFDALGNDDYLWVFHGTENGDLAAQGFKPGHVDEFEGDVEGTYVSVTPDIAAKYAGDSGHLLAVRVRKADVYPSPEGLAMADADDLTGVMEEALIHEAPPHNIITVQKRDLNDLTDELPGDTKQVGWEDQVSGEVYPVDDVVIDGFRQEGDAWVEQATGELWRRPAGHIGKRLAEEIQQEIGPHRYWPVRVFKDAEAEFMRLGEDRYKAVFDTAFEGIFNKTLALMRFGVTQYFPAYHVRNMTSDVLKSLQADSGVIFHPLMAARMTKLAMGRGKGFKAGKKYKFWTDLPAMTVEDALFTIEHHLGRSTQHMEEFARIVSRGKPAGRFQRWFSPGPAGNFGKGVVELGARREDIMRFVTFAQRLNRNGGDVADAAWYSIKHHFDYGDLSGFERHKVRNLFLFYTWYRKNIPLQFAELITRPGFMSGVVHSYYDLAEGETPFNVDWSKLHPMLPNMEGPVPTPGLIPDYMLDQLSAYTTNWNGHSAAFGIGAPWVDLNLPLNLLGDSEDREASLRQLWALSNPLASVGGALVFKEDPLTGRDFNVHEASPMAPVFEKLGFDLPKDEFGRPTLPWAASVFLRNVPIVGRASGYFSNNPSDVTDEGRLMSNRGAVSALAGVNVYISPDSENKQRTEDAYAKLAEGRAAEWRSIQADIDNLPDADRERIEKDFVDETWQWAAEHGVPKQIMKRTSGMPTEIYKSKENRGLGERPAAGTGLPSGDGYGLEGEGKGMTGDGKRLPSLTSISAPSSGSSGSSSSTGGGKSSRPKDVIASAKQVEKAAKSVKSKADADKVIKQAQEAVQHHNVKPPTQKELDEALKHADKDAAEAIKHFDGKAKQKPETIRVPSAISDKGERVFIAALAKETGMSPRVLTAWMRQEGGADDDFNVLNIGHTDSGDAEITGDKAWADPVAAAHATAGWLKGTFGQQYDYVADPDIQAILQSAGKSDQEQMDAIFNSPWSTADDGGSAMSIYESLGNGTVKTKIKGNIKTKRPIEIAELIYDHGVTIYDGQESAGPGDHLDHVHFATPNKKDMLFAIKLGERLGLKVSANEYVTGVPETSGHSENSWHYRTIGHKHGKTIQGAIDVTDPRHPGTSEATPALVKFNKILAAHNSGGAVSSSGTTTTAGTSSTASGTGATGSSAPSSASLSFGGGGGKGLLKGLSGGRGGRQKGFGGGGGASGGSAGSLAPTEAELYGDAPYFSSPTSESETVRALRRALRSEPKIPG